MLYKSCCKHEEEPLQRSAELFVKVTGAKQQLAFGLLLYQAFLLSCLA